MRRVSEYGDHYISLLNNDSKQLRGPQSRHSSRGWCLRSVTTLIVVGYSVVVMLLTYWVITRQTIPSPALDPPNHNNTALAYAEFHEFIKRFNKNYPSEMEFYKRFGIFTENLAFVQQENSIASSYQLSVNEFADLTLQEFTATRAAGYQREPHPFLSNDSKNYRESQHLFANSNTSEVDWVKRGCVTIPKDQGLCGSCWAFSTTGAIEGAFCAKHGTLISLSEQQLVDCSDEQGCNGGSMEDTFGWLSKHRGICSEQSYPYTAKRGHCHPCFPLVKIKGFESVQTQNKKALEHALTYSPVAVAIQASDRAFQFYSRGVFDGECGTALDHGVLAVGFGYDEEVQKPYWLIKNSWGPGWGLDGFIKLDRSLEGDGKCGILMDASYPELE